MASTAHSQVAPRRMHASAPRRARPPRPSEAHRAKTRAPDAEVIALAEQLRPGFALTHLDKLLYPEVGLSKAHLVTYYAAMAPQILPHIIRRPLTLLRCPDGSPGQCFFQKHVDRAVPRAIKRVKIRETRGEGCYGYVDDVDGLVALAQLGALEVHVWNSRVPALEQPDQLVMDLDPDAGLAWERVVEAAFDLRERLAALALTSFVKTSGGKGLHVVVPLAPVLDWDAQRAVARGLALQMVHDAPDRYVADMRKSARAGKIFIDYLRNGRGATAVAPYSTRALPHAPVATPIHWDELRAGVRPETFDLQGVVRRLERPTRDPWEGFVQLEQRLPEAALDALLRLGRSR